MNNIERSDNLEILTAEQKTEVLKNQVLEKVENLENADKIFEAIDLSLSLHSDQKDRPDGPYVDHILRVVNRLLDLGITDSDILVSSIFHDSIEDQAQKLADKIPTSQELEIRERALEFLRQKYGEKVAGIVNSVTNPEQIENLEPKESNREYALHIEHVIEDPDVFYVKLSDFMDNGLSFMNILDVRRKTKLAQKYLPLFEMFINRIKRDDMFFSQEKKDKIIEEFSNAKSFALEIAGESKV